MASEFDEPEWKQFSNNRKASRNSVRISAELLVSTGPRFKVAVLDLSRTGFRMETGNHLLHPKQDIFDYSIVSEPAGKNRMEPE